MINELMIKKNISKYKLSKLSGVPYSTISDICLGKSSLEKCSAETVYKLAGALEIDIKKLLEPYCEKRPAFDVFKSEMCHQLKEKGDLNFIVYVLESGDIRKYYNRGLYPESLYLLGMLDYISRVNEVTLCVDYDDLRKCKLEEIIYPSSLLVYASTMNDKKILSRAKKEAIPEFLRFNIVENDVRDVA